MKTEMLTFIIAFGTSLFLTIPVRRLALAIGMVDHPNARKLHKSPMPLLGGLAIYCGTVLAVMLSMEGNAGARCWASLLRVLCY